MSNTNPSASTAHEGLPTAEDYAPEEIGQAELEAGDAVQTWPEFGLEMVPVVMDDVDTGRRLIRRNGDYVADVTDSYKLLPNERAVEATNQVASDLGAIPFHEWEREDDRNDGWFIKLDDHVYQDQQRRRVHALYAWDSGTVGQDDMEYGFAVHNSIDGSLGFNVALFSFRHACQNMTHIGTNSFAQSRSLGVESERAVLSAEQHKHTSGLEVDVDALAQRVEDTLMLVDDVNETYNQWREDVIQPTHVDSLIRRFPYKDLPGWAKDIADALDAAAENEDLDGTDELTAERRAKIIRGETPDETIWDTYNDMTQAIWHDDRTSDNSKRRKFNQVHNVFPLQVQD